MSLPTPDQFLPAINKVKCLTFEKKTLIETLEHVLFWLKTHPDFFVWDITSEEDGEFGRVVTLYGKEDEE